MWACAHVDMMFSAMDALCRGLQGLFGHVLMWACAHVDMMFSAMHAHCRVVAGAVSFVPA